MSYVIATQQDKHLHFQHYNCYESRGKSVEKMIRAAISKHNIIKNFDILINTDDEPRFFGIEKKTKHFCTTNDNFSDVFPDFYYESWPEINVDSYSDLTLGLRDFSTEPETSKVGWIGTLLCEKRRQLFEACKVLPQYECIDINWVRQNSGRLNAAKYLDYYDQVKRWKYLLDVEGGGWSARLKVLLSTQRIVFIVDRKFKDWCFEFLEPWVHFVPIKNDLSDLVENYNRIEGDKKLQQSILTKQRELYHQCLSTESAIDKIAQIINES
jgi:hypothetical protein